MEDNLKKNKKLKMTSKNENGRRPHFFLKNKNDDLKKRKEDDLTKQKMEHDLKRTKKMTSTTKNGRQPKK